MSAQSKELPRYSNPPVAEVVLGVRFAPLEGLRSPHIGMLWATKFRSKFPKIEEALPNSARSEGFGLRELTNAGTTVDARPRPLVVPVRFVDVADTRAIQVEQESFRRYWRKTADQSIYPRFRHIRRQFERDIIVFREFVSREGLGELAPDQCEVTYVNHIPAGKGWERPGQLERVLAPWAGLPRDGFLPEPEEVAVATRYTMVAGDDSTPVGHLHVTVQPASRAVDDQPIIVMEMTARGRPLGDGDEGVVSFLDLGHEWIGRAFTSLTTGHMHSIWGRHRLIG